MSGDIFYNPGEYIPTKGDEAREDAYDSGISAFDEGLAETQNPFEPINQRELYLRWSDGYVNRRDGAE